MDLSKYTQKSQEAIMDAQNLAVEHHHQELNSKHLLYALVFQKDGIVPKIIEKAGANINQVKSLAEDLIKKIPVVHGYDGPLTMSTNLARVFVRAEKEAQNMKDEYVSVEHLLLALLEEGDADVKDALRKAGLDRVNILSGLKKVRGGQQVTSEKSGGYLQCPGKIR